MKPITITGMVIHGANRGKALGFPTANLDAAHTVKDGIYISRATVQKQDLASLTFIGQPLVFHETGRRLEVYLLDFEGDLYGQHLKVTLLEKIRDNQSFSNQEALTTQMKQDVEIARNFFAKRPISSS